MKRISAVRVHDIPAEIVPAFRQMYDDVVGPSIRPIHTQFHFAAECEDGDEQWWPYVERIIENGSERPVPAGFDRGGLYTTECVSPSADQAIESLLLVCSSLLMFGVGEQEETAIEAET